MMPLILKYRPLYNLTIFHSRPLSLPSWQIKSIQLPFQQTTGFYCLLPSAGPSLSVLFPNTCLWTFSVIQVMVVLVFNLRATGPLIVTWRCFAPDSKRLLQFCFSFSFLLQFFFKNTNFCSLPAHRLLCSVDQKLWMLYSSIHAVLWFGLCFIARKKSQRLCVRMKKWLLQAY